MGVLRCPPPSPLKANTILGGWSRVGGAGSVVVVCCMASYINVHVVCKQLEI